MMGWRSGLRKNRKKWEPEAIKTSTVFLFFHPLSFLFHITSITMAGAMDQQAKHALKRLNSDYKEIQKSPIVGVSASPLEKDIFEVLLLINLQLLNTHYY